MLIKQHNPDTNVPSYNLRFQLRQTIKKIPTVVEGQEVTLV